MIDSTYSVSDFFVDVLSLMLAHPVETVAYIVLFLLALWLVAGCVGLILGVLMWIGLLVGRMLDGVFALLNRKKEPPPAPRITITRGPDGRFKRVDWRHD